MAPCEFSLILLYGGPYHESELMPKTRFYEGKPVKRMRRVPGGLLLTLYSREKGKPGRQLTISQAEWDQLGAIEEVESTRAEDLRKLVPVS